MLGLKILILFMVLRTARMNFNYMTISTYDGVADNAIPEFNSLSYVKLGKKYYYFGFEEKSWFGAAIYCHQNNGHLATIANQEEWEVVYGYLLENGKDSNWWISYTDQEREGTFVSITDGTTWSLDKWDEDEPNNNYNEHCIGLRGARSYLLNDFPCDYKCNFICQIKSPKTISFTVW